MGIYNKHNWRIDVHAKFLTDVSQFSRVFVGWAPCSFMPAPCGWMSALRHLDPLRFSGMVYLTELWWFSMANSENFHHGTFPYHPNYIPLRHPFILQKCWWNISISSQLYPPQMHPFYPTASLIRGLCRDSPCTKSLEVWCPPVDGMIWCTTAVKGRWEPRLVSWPPWPMVGWTSWHMEGRLQASKNSSKIQWNHKKTSQGLDINNWINRLCCHLLGFCKFCIHNITWHNKIMWQKRK